MNGDSAVSRTAPGKRANRRVRVSWASQAREGGAEAEVGAAAERQVGRARAGQVEPVRVGEAARVAVGGVDTDQDLLARADAVAAEEVVGERDAAGEP